MMNTISSKKLLLFSTATGLFLGILAALLLSVTHPGTQEILSCRVIRISDSWGYEILNGNKVIIHQEIIPSLPGYQSFSSRRDALRTGELVLQKIRKGDRPTISIQDLERLKVDFTNTGNR